MSDEPRALEDYPFIIAAKNKGLIIERHGHYYLYKEQYKKEDIVGFYPGSLHPIKIRIIVRYTKEINVPLFIERYKLEYPEVCRLMLFHIDEFRQ